MAARRWKPWSGRACSGSKATGSWRAASSACSRFLPRHRGPLDHRWVGQPNRNIRRGSAFPGLSRAGAGAPSPGMPSNRRFRPEALSMAPSSTPGQAQPLVLVLGGGNALGSYLAGACEHLLGQDMEPQWIVGGSIGAVMGAIIAGNAPEDRLPRLRAFWDEAAIRTPGLLGRGSKSRHVYNEIHTAMALLFGRPGLFGHRFPGPLSMLPWMPDDTALYDH